MTTKTISTGLLQAAIILTGLGAVVVLAWFPLLEGRAANLDLPAIYLDPFILYGYAASAAFFTGLYQVFRLLGYVRRGECPSRKALGALRIIRYCAIVSAVLIAAAGLYIKVAHHPDDDPAGFLAMCMILIAVAVAVAFAAGSAERKWGAAVGREP
ncbi:hypothetical protein GGR26_000068 [Lewinella marina]|uniref:DUF2975 domain-containing protein n=1 Tax=Neolewinella marina TaxID=438751 RepID=A0A2G0CKR4_9BACT|nr:DUF2975 domain-containing protein [Neolewinella marina]NJB84323.1 hypothetical protein [Neolewinella marina]PHL00563.1 hypothetical protein CGL56_05445 [Neolewinella marina]